MSTYPAPTGQVPSPCRSLCKLDDERFCIGCGRHVDDIRAWRTMTDPERLACVARAAEKKRRLESRPN